MCHDLIYALWFVEMDTLYTGIRLLIVLHIVRSTLILQILVQALKCDTFIEQDIIIFLFMSADKVTYLLLWSCGVGHSCTPVLIDFYCESD